MDWWEELELEYQNRSVRNSFFKKRNKESRAWLVEKILIYPYWTKNGAEEFVKKLNKQVLTRHYAKKWYNIFFVKLYFEWNYLILGRKFTKKDLEERPNEDELIEILYIIERRANFTIRDLECPFSFEDILKKYEEVVGNDG